jgi:hypothetical protein
LSEGDYVIVAAQIVIEQAEFDVLTAATVPRPRDLCALCIAERDIGERDKARRNRIG